MARDTYLQLRTPLLPGEVRAALERGLALADLNLAMGPDGWVRGRGVYVTVDPWDPDPEDGDRHLIDGDFEMADLVATITWNLGNLGTWRRVVASLLRQVPGDACMADQDSAGPELLRLDGTVYVGPDACRPEDLTGSGYVPERLIVGIPPGLAAAVPADAA